MLTRISLLAVIFRGNPAICLLNRPSNWEASKADPEEFSNYCLSVHKRRERTEGDQVTKVEYFTAYFWTLAAVSF